MAGEAVRPAGEYGFIHLTPAVGRLNVRDRARLVLEAVHGAVLLLAEYRGWDPTQFQSCYDHVVTQDFEYRWASAWKSSPDRRHQARAVYRLAADDGWGRVRLEIRDRSTEQVIGASDDAIAFCTSKGFVRSAKTLRWHSPSQVGLTPYCSFFGDYSGTLTGTERVSSWAFEAHDEMTVRQPGGDWVDPPVKSRQLPRVVPVRD